MANPAESISQAMRTVAAAHTALGDYYQELAAFFQLVDDALAKPEGGRSLIPISKERLISSSSDFALERPNEWLSPWLARFYVDAAIVPEGRTPDDCTGETAYNFAFVWICAKDTAVSVQEPECWIGVSNPGFKNLNERAYNVADKMWEQFRWDLGSPSSDGWFEGRFPKQKFGFASGGFWLLQRIPLSRIDSVAQIFGLVAQPLQRRYTERFRSVP